MIAASWWAASSRGSSRNTRQHKPARLQYLWRHSLKTCAGCVCVCGGWVGGPQQEVKNGHSAQPPAGRQKGCGHAHMWLPVDMSFVAACSGVCMAGWLSGGGGVATTGQAQQQTVVRPTPPTHLHILQHPTPPHRSLRLTPPTCETASAAPY